MWSSYQEMYMNIDNEKLLIEKRLEMVRFANENGIKKAARFYACTKNTIKKWCRRYTAYGLKGLIDRSRKPKNSPKQINQEDIDIITQVAKEKKKHITVKNVRKKSGVKEHSDATINRYINKAIGKKKNRKHDPSNGGDISWKKKLLPFQLIQIDIKYLTDIDNLKPYFSCEKNNYKGIKCKYQITARDVCTGMAIVSYCDEKSIFYTKMFLEDILYPFLKQFKGLNLKKITIQTDNGYEFTNKRTRTNGKEAIMSKFTMFVEDKFKKHKKQNLRDHMSPVELVLTALGEVTTTELHRARDSQGMNELMTDAYDGGEIASITRKNIETKTGRPVLRSQNAIDFKKEKELIQNK